LIRGKKETGHFLTTLKEKEGKTCTISPSIINHQRRKKRSLPRKDSEGTVRRSKSITAHSVPGEKGTKGSPPQKKNPSRKTSFLEKRSIPFCFQKGQHGPGLESFSSAHREKKESQPPFPTTNWRKKNKGGLFRSRRRRSMSEEERDHRSHVGEKGERKGGPLP